MSRRRNRAADPSGTHRTAACRPGAGLVVTAALLLAPLAACSSGSDRTARPREAATGRATTTTTTPASASAYIAALAEGGAAGALKMAAAAAPGSPARQYAELLARLVGLGVAPPPSWSATTPVPPASTTTPAPAAAPSSTSVPQPVGLTTGPTTDPASAPTAPTGPTPGSPGAPPSTAPPPPPPPRVETDGDAFRICSGARCERYDHLTFADGLVADLHRGGRPLTDQFARPGEPVTKDGVTVQLAGAALDALGRLVVVVRAGNGSTTRWNLGYVQRHSAPGGPEHDDAGVALGPSALDPGQAADLGLPFPGASLGGTVHITTFLGPVSDPAAKVVYFDLPLR